MAFLKPQVYFGTYFRVETTFGDEIVPDGYTPFQDGARVSWIEVGLAVDLGRR